MIRRNPKLNYHPSYWLAALGAGGTSVSFFMYLMWLIPHKNTPIPTFADLQAQLSSGGVLAVITIAAIIAIIGFAVLHLALLGWNIVESRIHKKDLDALNNTPAELQKMASPLTFAMTVNVFFILGALFVPGLWNYVEYLFPGAVIAFAIIAYFATRQFGTYMANTIRSGGHQSKEHNHLSGLISVFTFAMLAVGFAASSAMSHVEATVAIATTLSVAFGVFAFVLAIIVVTHGLNAMMEHGLAHPASPSIWMLIPILTLLGITWVRLSHGFTHIYGVESHAGNLFLPLTILFSLQIGTLALGYKVMKANGYLKAYLRGDEESPVSFGLICPGVALFVLGMFWWHIGWVKTGIITQFSPIYWLGIIALFTVQLVTVTALFKLT
jgi:hypothetical protein